VLPDTSVGGVDCAGPIIDLLFPDRGGYCFLQGESGQGRHLGWEVIVGGSFSANGGDGQDEVAQVISLFESATFSQEQNRFGPNGGQQVHDRGRGRRSHAEIDQGDVIGGDAGHGSIATDDGGVVPFRKEFQVMTEIGEQDVLAELVERLPGIPRQPVLNDLFFGLHATEIKQLVLMHAFPG
jgi:hypothetical protein